MPKRLAKLTLCALVALCADVAYSQPPKDESPLNKIDAEVSRVCEQSRDTVVRIHAYADEGKIRRRSDLAPYRVGTGFIIDAEHGWVATTANNVDDADKIEIEWRGKKYQTILLGIDLYSNFAMLRIQAGSNDPLPALKLADSDALKPGLTVINVGFAFNIAGLTPTWGILGGMDKTRGRSVFQVAHLRSNVKVYPGQGGGPLLDANGDVIGMIVAATQLDEATYSLPSNAIRKLRDDFLNNGKARYGWTGLSVTDKDFPPNTDGEPQRFPVVTAIAPDSPATKIDVKIGDIIEAVEDIAISSSTEIPSLTFFKRDGDPLRLRILRDGQKHLLTLELGERPTNFVPYQRNTPSSPSGNPTLPTRPQTVPASTPQK